MAEPRVTLVKAGTLVDGESVLFAPGAILLQPGPVGWKILAVGRPQDVARHPAALAARVIDQSNSVVCPALVNAHSHLDLSHIGPWQMPENGGFEVFVAKIRAERLTTDVEIRASVRSGIDASRRGGVVAVGDIAGAATGIPQLGPWREMRASQFAGTSYIEFFAIGNSQQRGLATVTAAIQDAVREPADPMIRLGIHPHAPYSVSLPGYQAALELCKRFGLPACSHVAESAAEHEFVRHGTGPLRDFLERAGLWNHTPEGIGTGKSPLAHVLSVPGSGDLCLVHLNDLSDSDLAMLPMDAVAIYCPRSSEYFGAERAFGPHRYRDLIRRGIKVALGTDSIVNLLDQAGPLPRISTWDEMCLLHQRDGTDERLLLRMATTWGAAAIGMSASYFELREGLDVIDLIGIMLPPYSSLGFGQALRSGAVPTLLLDKKLSC